MQCFRKDTHMKRSFFTSRDKHAAEYAQSSQNKCSGLIQPSTYFVQGENDKGFRWEFNCTVDELCEINVHAESSDIQADSVISTGYCKPMNGKREKLDMSCIYQINF